METYTIWVDANADQIGSNGLASWTGAGNVPWMTIFVNGKMCGEIHRWNDVEEMHHGDTYPGMR
jgi:hypothetical protein